MAQVISISFSGQVNLEANTYTYVSDFDTNGVVYALGTNFGTTGFSNPAPGGAADMRVYINNGGGDTEKSGERTDRNLSVGSFDNISASGQYIRCEFPNHRLICTRITIQSDGGSGAAQFTPYGAADEGNGALTQIGTTQTPAASGWSSFVCTSNTAFKGFQVRWTGGSGSLFIDQIELYGVLIAEDNTTIGTAPGNTLPGMNDGFVHNTAGTGGVLRFNDALFPTSDLLYEAAEAVLTGDFEIGSLNQDPIISIDPNGADRNVILPQAPFCGYYLKLISADGAFKLNIRETVGGAIQHEMSTANNSLVATCIWSGTTWHITG